MRILDVDPYDEDAHLGMIRSLLAQRRHGEARRAYRAYCARLAELDLDQPYPGAAAEGQRGRAGSPKRPSLPEGWLDDADGTDVHLREDASETDGG